jgi:leader peptidase (prepilin peptidase)/N-methyltransferase
MLLATVLGGSVGIALNMLADRMPSAAKQRPGGLRRAFRLGALTLLCIALYIYLQHAQGWSVPFAAQAAFCSLLLLIGTIDLERSIVPNVLVGLGILLALGFSLVRSSSGPGFATALEGAALGGGVFLLLALARRNALGFGDVKLAVLIGMMTGFPWVMQALIVGIVLGGLSAAVLLLTRTRGARQYIPYAPYLVAGCIATLLWGARIAAWYAGLLGGKR